MRIFARSLLSYWLTTLLTVAMGALLLTSTGLGRDDQVRAIPLAHLQACVRASAGLFSQQVSPAQRMQSLAALDCPIRLLVAPDGQELYRNDLTADIEHLLSRQKVLGNTPLIEVRPNQTVLAFPIPYGAATYHAVAVLSGAQSRFPAFFWVHLVSAVGISGLVFWLLARQFSQPIYRLQHVTERVASGDMSSRPERTLLDRSDELGDLSRSVNLMVARISDLMSSQRSFLAQVSHELGTPLTRLNLALALARRKAGPDLLPELKRLEYEAAQLNSMVQQLLLLARLENATEHGQTPQRFRLEHLLREVADDSQFEAKQNAKTVALRGFEANEWDLVEILGYRDLLKRALENICRNAVHYTSPGGVVEIECCELSDGWLRVRIQDNGQGVPTDQLEKVFEPFVRLGSNRRTGGAGLGLAIAKHAVLTHHGRVFAANASPHGLVVTIELPVAPAYHPETGTSPDS